MGFLGIIWVLKDFLRLVVYSFGDYGRSVWDFFQLIFSFNFSSRGDKERRKMVFWLFKESGKQIAQFIYLFGCNFEALNGTHHDTDSMFEPRKYEISFFFQVVLAYYIQIDGITSYFYNKSLKMALVLAGQISLNFDH